MSRSASQPIGAAAYAAIFASDAIGVVLWKGGGSILETNTTFRRMLGYSDTSAQPIGTTLDELACAEQKGALTATLREVAARQSCQLLDLTCTGEQGRTIAVLVAVLGVSLLEEGGVCLFFELAGSTAGSASNTLVSADLAHKINNPLAYAIGNLSFAIEQLQALSDMAPQLAPVIMALRDALEGTERVRVAVRDLNRLPSPPQVAESASPSQEVNDAPKGARVLVVDDEPRIGSAIARILTPVYEVTTVYTARDALAKLESGERYDVILCDIMMPEMSGIDLYRALEQSAPEVARRMIFMTGGPFSTRGTSFLETLSNPRLEKPFSPDALRSLIQEAVALASSRRITSPAR
ncbi:MAG TPA: response regulator [Polyangiaceae bacterium]